MRTILLLVCIFAMSLASSSVTAESADPRIESLAWLSGHWDRMDLPEGHAGHEQWRREGSGLAGTGSMQRDGQTVFEEKLGIEVDGDGVFYVADVPGNAAPVRFRMVEQSEGAAVFENPDHDFPKRIAYRRDGNRLHAQISGSGRDIAFVFGRSTDTTSTDNDDSMEPVMHNLISWFEIPVSDFDRALRFYATVLDASLETVNMGETRMGMFPNDGRNVSGAIVHGDDYEPGTQGPLVYLSGGDDLSPMLARVAEAGGNIIVPKTEISPEFGHFALFIDSEGNRIGLHSPN